MRSLDPEAAQAYRPADAARALGIGKTKLYEYIGSGEIELIKLTERTSIIPAESLKAFIDRRRLSTGDNLQSPPEHRP